MCGTVGRIDAGVVGIVVCFMIADDVDSSVFVVIICVVVDSVKSKLKIMK